jgi:menaquinone-9 beta-reductase
LFLVGDAARVVEPFTGEGIYYALRSGELAAQALVKIIHGNDSSDPVTEYAEAHAAMYRGRLWVNQLSRSAVLAPRFASLFVHLARVQPSILRLLTAKIVTSN